VTIRPGTRPGHRRYSARPLVRAASRSSIRPPPAPSQRVGRSGRGARSVAAAPCAVAAGPRTAPPSCSCRTTRLTITPQSRWRT